MRRSRPRRVVGAHAHLGVPWPGVARVRGAGDL